MQRIKNQICVVWLACCALSSVYAQRPATDKPESVGMSSERLQRINQLIERKIKDEKIVGALTLVARRGKLSLRQGIPISKRTSRSRTMRSFASTP
jgi:hypothetical protein